MTAEPKWPFEQERNNPLARARRVAQMYRTALGIFNAQLRDQCDKTAASFGEMWIIDKAELYEDDDHLTARQVAELLCVSVESVRQYRLRGRLRGFKTCDGWRYLYSDVRSMSTAQMGRPKKDAGTKAA